ncbi:MAG: potassium channel protein [Planctomycetota bacterium]
MSQGLDPIEASLGLAMSRREERARIRIAIGLCLAVLLWGTVGMHWIEGWSLWESFYFTLITITTVGYGDHGASVHGQQFATVLMVVGIGAVSYSFAAVVQGMVANQLAWRRRMQGRIDKLDRHIVLVGYTRIGRTITDELRSAGKPFVVVENCADRAREAISAGHATVLGDATNEDVLRSAGIERATHLVAALDSSTDQIVTVLTARGIRPDLVVLASANGDKEVAKLRLAGVDRTVSPFHLGGVELAQRILRPKVADFLSHQSSDTNLALAQVEVGADSSLLGRSLVELGRDRFPRVCFVTLDRPGQQPLTPPGGNQVLRAGDHLIVAGDPDQVAEMHAAGHDASELGATRTRSREAA